RQDCASGKIGALEIDRHHPVPFLGLDVLDERPGIDAGVLDENVEAAEEAQCLGGGMLGIGLSRNIASNESRLLESLCGFSACLRLGVGDHDARALFDEAPGNAGADAARPTDDESYTAFEPAAHASLCLTASL